MSPPDETATNTSVPASSLADNACVEVVVNRRAVLICRHQGVLHAVDARCPHQGQSLSGGRLRNGHIICPIHGAQFDLGTGEGRGTMAAGRRLTIHATEVRDGIVWLQLR